MKPVSPAYTSMIGALKYSPQYDLSKHTGAAMVVGRRSLGLQERIPDNLLKLTEDYLEKHTKKGKKKRSRSLPGTVRVPQRKKEAKPINPRDWSSWKVVRLAALTALSTGRNKVYWSKLNPSALKKLLFDRESRKPEELAKAPKELGSVPGPGP